MDLLDRLIDHRTLGSAPREELQWLIDHGEMRTFAAGSVIAARAAGRPEGMYILLQGRCSITVDRGAGPKKLIEWNTGDVMGLLPYSRQGAPPGDAVADEACEGLTILEASLPAMIRACHCVTTILVHVMVDRARHFNSGDMQDEKMVSLGKLSAGLAHELNNPASAVARSAKQLMTRLDEADRAGRDLGASGVSKAQLVLLEAAGDKCLLAPQSQIRSPIEQSDREEAIADWLDDHGAEQSIVDALAESGVSIEILDELAAELDPAILSLSLRWFAARCSLRILAMEIEQGANRISELVTAVKGFTYMDQARTPQPMDIGDGLRNTLTVLASKARSKSVAVNVHVPENLPRIVGFGGELNQVWANLIDNAVDAATDSGRVEIAASREGEKLVVRITDDGPGVPPEIRAQIFDPFFTTKPVGQGTGLGLDISRRLVKQSGGELTFESEPGRTTFTVALPIDPSSLTEVQS
jgi:signal transduction histidine kinase